MKLCHVVSTLFGIGERCRSPGTVGSAVCILFIVPVLHFFQILSTPVLVLLIFGGTLAIHHSLKEKRTKDPQEIIIDEVAGQALTYQILRDFLSYFGLWQSINQNGPVLLALIMMSFFSFRAFDIIKPQPVKCAERLVGEYGIMADDLVAALFAASSLFCLVYVLVAFLNST